jgi:hypothetical protein
VNGTARRWDGLLFVLPFLFFYLVILIYPLLRGMALSFQRVDLFGGGTFVGFANYARLFADATFIQSLVNTFVLALMIVPVLTALALALALALNRATRGAAIFRGIFFSSSVLSVTIVTLIWRFVLAPGRGAVGRGGAGARRRAHSLSQPPDLVALGARAHHHLVVDRPADDVVPRRPAADTGGYVRGGGARPRKRLEDLSAHHRSRRSSGRWCWW